MGALFDIGIQHLGSIWEWGWSCVSGNSSSVTVKATDWCSVVLSAIIGCAAAPVGAAFIEPWVTKQLAKIGIGGAIGGASASLMSKVLLFIAKKISVGIPKSITGTLVKMNCITDAEARQLENPDGQGNQIQDNSQDKSNSKEDSKNRMIGDRDTWSQRTLAYKKCVDKCISEAPRVADAELVKLKCAVQCKG